MRVYSNPILNLGIGFLGNIRDVYKFSLNRFKETLKSIHFPEKEKSAFSVKEIFNYFLFWQTKFEVNDLILGGKTDYSQERISLLNFPGLKDFIDLNNLSVLELGPLEGGNTLKLCQMGVRKVIAVEGRVENYIKCCVIKNIFQLDQVQIVFDDIRNISRKVFGEFDVALLAGVLYHLDNPHQLLEKLSDMTGTLLVATHYADETSPSKMAKIVTLETRFGRYRGKMYHEGAQVNINSGFQPRSFWPLKEDLFRMFRDTGFQKIDIIRNNPRPEDPFKLVYFLAKK